MQRIWLGVVIDLDYNYICTLKACLKVFLSILDGYLPGVIGIHVLAIILLVAHWRVLCNYSKAKIYILKVPRGGGSKFDSR